MKTEKLLITRNRLHLVMISDGDGKQGFWRRLVVKQCKCNETQYKRVMSKGTFYKPIAHAIRCNIHINTIKNYIY